MSKTTKTLLTKSGKTLASEIKPGVVCRRSDLKLASKAVDRNLKELQNSGKIVKLSQGLYYKPVQSVYGALPPTDKKAVKAFLQDDNFLLFSPAAYNTLGVRTTQLYNKTLVYNHKRHGQFSLGQRTYDFRRKQNFPRKLNPEFLLVDLINNLKEFPEERDIIIDSAKKVAKKLNREKLNRAILNYGLVATRKKFKAWLDE